VWDLHVVSPKKLYALSDTPRGDNQPAVDRGDSDATVLGGVPSVLAVAVGLYRMVHRIVFFSTAPHTSSLRCTYSLGPETPESLTAPARVCTPTLETSRNAHTQTTLSGRPSPPHPLPPSEPAPKPTVPPTPRCHPRAHPATCHGARPRLSRRAPPAGRRCTPPRPGCSSARAGSRS